MNYNSSPPMRPTNERLHAERLKALRAVATVCVLASSVAATGEAQKAPAKPAKPAVAAAVATAPVDGAKLFATTCAACHQVSGDGLEDKYPPLNGSEWVTGDEQKLIRIVMHGLS